MGGVFEGVEESFVFCVGEREDAMGWDLTIEAGGGTLQPAVTNDIRRRKQGSEQGIKVAEVKRGHGGTAEEILGCEQGGG